jgi:hypothetical protein
MNETTTVQGREITQDDIELVRRLIEADPSRNRTRLSQELCLLWNWRAANGQIKDMACRTLLLKLEQREATLGQDTSLVETYKQEALHCYQGYKAYQPMTTYWSEQDLVAHSEFRDGNVPANYRNLRALQ